MSVCCRAETGLKSLGDVGLDYVVECISPLGVCKRPPMSTFSPRPIRSSTQKKPTAQLPTSSPTRHNLVHDVSGLLAAVSVEGTALFVVGAVLIYVFYRYIKGTF